MKTYEYRLMGTNGDNAGIFAVTDDLGCLHSFMELNRGYLLEIPFDDSLKYKKHMYASELKEHQRVYGVFGY